jgi:hypothetical protein
MDYSQVSNTQGFLVMKLQGLLTLSVKMSTDGSPVNEWLLAGMVVIAATVNPAGVEIS